MLCGICLDIFRGSFPVQHSVHHGSIKSLQRSALENCDICHILWTWISCQSQPGPEHVHVSTKANLESRDDEVIKKLRIQANIPPYKREWTIICEPAGEDCKDSNANKSYDHSDWTASMACARTWLAECVEKHPNCPGPCSSQRTVRDTSKVSDQVVIGESETYCPTRLIEIGQPEADRVCLRLRSELDGTSPHYATLSHCWGTSKTLRLTSESFPRLRKGVAISELAKTFQNAIFTARSLGIKLLWIDSFCIFQDSKEDWQQESGLMSQVYRHSFLNIAASIASDSDAGCFRERASAIKPCLVQTAWTDHPNDIYHVYDEDCWYENFERMPLNHRAWVVQELALAPRVLHLCGSQMFWECHGLSACETWPTGLPSGMYNFSMKSNTWPAAVKIFGSEKTNEIGTRRISSTDEHAGLNTVAFRRLWTKVVRDYSMCDLTFPSDKLVALSGVAKHMEQLLDIEYCAGLWRFDLVAGLAWYFDKQYKMQYLPPIGTDAVTYRAPSWSWACLDGPIALHGFHSPQCHHLVDIIGCDIKTATADRTGAVVGASLQLSGYLATMKLHPNFEETREVYFDARWTGLSGRPLDLDRRPSSSQTHCLPLFVDGQWLCALLLTPTRAIRGQFQRTGIFWEHSTSLGLEDWNSFPEFKNESWLEYESASDDGKYIISIV